MLGKNRGKSQRGTSQESRASNDTVDSSGRVASSRLRPLTIPPKVGSDLAFTPLPSAVEPRTALEAIKSTSRLCHANCLAPPSAYLTQYRSPCYVQNQICSRTVSHIRRAWKGLVYATNY